MSRALGESVQGVTRLRTSSTLLVLLSLTAFLSTILFGMREEASVVPIFHFAFGILGYTIARRWGRAESRIFLWAYCGATLAAIALFAVYNERYGTPYYVGGSDDLGYERAAQAVASYLDVYEYGEMTDVVEKQFHRSIGYVYLVSLLYRVAEPFGGFHTMLPRLLNCMAQALIATLTYRVARQYGLTDRSALWTALFVGFSPIMVYNAIHTFRDTIATLLILWVVYVWGTGTHRLHIWRRFFLWVQTLIVAGFVSQLRVAQAVAILGIAAIGDLFLPRGKLRFSSLDSLYRLALATVLCLVVFGLFWDDALGFLLRMLDAQARYTVYRVGLSDGLSAYVFGAPAPLNFILRVPYALVTPLPILSTSPDRLWLSVGSLLWYFLLPFLIIGLVHTAGDRSKVQLLGAFVILFGGMALITFTSRHISQFLPFGTLIAGIGLERYRRYRTTIWLLTGWFGGCLVLAYTFLKYG